MCFIKIVEVNLCVQCAMCMPYILNEKKIHNQEHMFTKGTYTAAHTARLMRDYAVDVHTAHSTQRTVRNHRKTSLILLRDAEEPQCTRLNTLTTTIAFRHQSSAS